MANLKDDLELLEAMLEDIEELILSKPETLLVHAINNAMATRPKIAGPICGQVSLCIADKGVALVALKCNTAEEVEHSLRHIGMLLSLHVNKTIDLTKELPDNVTKH